MEKTKYERMGKEERKKLVEKYKKTEAGSALLNRLTRLRITGIIGLIFACFLFFSDLKNIEMKDYLVIVPLFLASILFIMMSYKLKKKVLIRFAVKK